ncbi:MAG: polyhydroxyalkanoate synthesis repressor PhaR [Polaribacter sp.]|jgi:polyhydroxyalkanoate synthesis repressor PhaR
MQRVEVATNSKSEINKTNSQQVNRLTKKEMPTERIIKKYPNRRLYDTQISRYITLHDVKKLVMEHKDFQVIDAKTNENLTRCTLMQLIAEEETNGAPILTSEILKEFVRFYGDSMQTMMSRFLEHSVKLFMEKRAGLKSPLNSMLGTNKSSLMQNIAKQNMKSFENKPTEDQSVNFTTVEVEQ